VDSSSPGCALPPLPQCRLCIPPDDASSIQDKCDVKDETSANAKDDDLPKLSRTFAVRRRSGFPKGKFSLRSLPTAMFLALGNGVTNAASEEDAANQEAGYESQYRNVCVVVCFTRSCKGGIESREADETTCEATRRMGRQPESDRTASKTSKSRASLKW